MYIRCIFCVCTNDIPKLNMAILHAGQGRGTSNIHQCQVRGTSVYAKTYTNVCADDPIANPRRSSAQTCANMRKRCTNICKHCANTKQICADIISAQTMRKDACKCANTTRTQTLCKCCSYYAQSMRKHRANICLV
jgi:hypothetical protein